MTRTLARRLEAVEAALSPLQRAYRLIAAGEPPECWPDAELEAYCAERPELELLTDDELDEIIAAPLDRAEALTLRLLEGHGYGR